LGDDISKVQIVKGKCQRNKDNLSMITPNSHYAGFRRGRVVQKRQVSQNL